MKLSRRLFGRLVLPGRRRLLVALLAELREQRLGLAGTKEKFVSTRILLFLSL